MKQFLTVITLALLTINPVKGEVLAKKKIVEPDADSLTIFIQAGDSCMQQYNTFGALKYFKEAFARCDSSLTRIKLADCYYKRANYRKTSELLKNIPTDSLSHEAFRQLCYSYQKQGDTDSYVYWTGHLVSLYPMDGEMVAGLTLAHAKQEQAFKGIECGKAYFEKDSTNILVNRALADAYFIDRQFDKAVTMYERLLHQGDSTFNTLYSAGMCYTRIDMCFSLILHFAVRSR